MNADYKCDKVWQVKMMLNSQDRGVIKMSNALKQMSRAELVNLERLARLLRGLSPAELETLEILLDEEASRTITQSLRELEQGKGIPINEWA